MINLHALICVNITSAALLALGHFGGGVFVQVCGGVFYVLSSIFCLASFTIYKDTIRQNNKRMERSIDDIMAVATETLDDIAASARPRDMAN